MEQNWSEIGADFLNRSVLKDKNGGRGLVFAGYCYFYGFLMLKKILGTMGWPFLIYFTSSIFEVQIGAKLERNWSKIGAFKRGFEIPSKYSSVKQSKQTSH